MRRLRAFTAAFAVRASLRALVTVRAVSVEATSPLAHRRRPTRAVGRGFRCPMDGPGMIPGGGAGEFGQLLGDWPLEQKRVASRILTLMNTPGNVRNDMIIDKSRVGRIIGPQGSTLKVGSCRTIR